MKIVHVTNHFWPCIGGIETVVWNTCTELVKQGHSVRVVCLNTCAKSRKKLIEKEIINGIEIVRLPYWNFTYYLVTPRVLNYVKDADIVHVHGLGFFSDYLLLNKKKIGKPLVISTHGGVFHTKNLKWIKDIYFYAIQKQLLKKADAVIAVSKKDIELFSKIVENKKLHVIENSIPLDEFLKLPIRKEKNTFLFVGRFSKNKQIDLLIKIFAGVKKEIPNAKLWIVGKDFDGIEKELKNLISKLNAQDCIFLEGEKTREELMHYYSKTEFFISASAYEGFGVTAIEAMAIGCIPILNKIPTFEEFVENNKNGLLVDAENSENAISGILEFLQKNDRTTLAKNAQKTALAYDIRTAVSKLLTTYREVIP